MVVVALAAGAAINIAGLILASAMNDIAWVAAHSAFTVFCGLMCIAQAISDKQR